MTNDDPRTERILSRIRRIPKGRVRTFGDIDPWAPRIVGRVLHETDENVPWFRVVRADGSLPQGDRQRDLLVADGVPMKGDCVDMRVARDEFDPVDFIAPADAAARRRTGRSSSRGTAVR